MHQVALFTKILILPTHRPVWESWRCWNRKGVPYDGETKYILEAKIHYVTRIS